MTLNIPVGYYEVALEHHLGGSPRPAVCTFGVQYTGADFALDFQFLALAWGQKMMGSVNGSWTFAEARARDQLGAVAALAQSVAGGSSHPAATPNVAFLCQKRTGLGGRRNHGRFYLPGVSEQDVDGSGNVDPSKTTELINNLSNTLGDWSTHHFFVVLLHNGAFAPTPVTFFGWSSVCATQRRRLRK